jgi:hypothetical protein
MYAMKPVGAMTINPKGAVIINDVSQAGCGVDAHQIESCNFLNRDSP